MPKGSDATDQTLYMKIKNRIKKRLKKNGQRWGLYTSSELVKTYKKEFQKKHPNKSPYKTSKKKSEISGTTRWYKEKWIRVKPYVTSKKIIKCGSSNKKNHACRPLHRVTKDTPITIKEALKKHGKNKMLSLANKKEQDMLGTRVHWKKGIATKFRFDNANDMKQNIMMLIHKQLPMAFVMLRDRCISRLSISHKGELSFYYNPTYITSETKKEKMKRILFSLICKYIE